MSLTLSKIKYQQLLGGKATTTKVCLEQSTKPYKKRVSITQVSVFC